VPAGFGLVLDSSVRRPRPEVVVGGSPLRVLRLRPEGASLLDRWVRGEPIGSDRGAQRLARRLTDAGVAHPRPPAGAGPAADAVTIVIPVRDQPAGLATTRAALGETQALIIVDDGSVPRVAAAGAEIIRHPTSRGPAAARNTGWRAAGDTVVVFLDADCEPTPGWLAALLPHFADPAVGAVAPRVRSRPSPDSSPRLAAYEARRSALDLGPRPASVRPGSRVPYVPTAALAVRRQALEEAGGFDEALRYGEDVDLVWRLGKRGWRVRYEPAATVTHPARPDSASWLRQHYHYGRSAAPLAARHGRAVAPVAVSRWSAAAWGLAAAGHPIAGAGLVAASSAALARRTRQDRATARTLAGLAVTGNLRAGAALARAVRRAWLPPVAVIAGGAARSGRRAPLIALAATLSVPLLWDWLADRPPGLSPVTGATLELVDDLAYQTGVWAGMIEHRSAAALLPG
jgi:mycofactocin system glycosyltransferase